MSDGTDIEIVSGRELHERVIEGSVLVATRRVWIATADLKDMHVRLAGKRYAPILEVFDRLAASGVRFRIVHSSVPSRPFRDTLEGYPRLVGGALELQICPRSHWKMVLVDGAFAYFGSANFTGAGLGVKRAERRNLEIGAVTRDPARVRRLEQLFDSFWIGEHCTDCAYRDRCPDPIG
jgi:phosphatidylserine/phosphatidylglycerophosphate/cardiolipin synthase-like enzyme